jgi:hypothetical protein
MLKEWFFAVYRPGIGFGGSGFIRLKRLEQRAFLVILDILYSVPSSRITMENFKRGTNLIASAPVVKKRFSFLTACFF